MTPTVTVIVPIYNVQAYLRQCLDSICGQTLSNIQILCVDDESSDLSGEIADSYATKDDRVHVIHRENGGYGAAVNAALSLATGTYVAIVEPDDYLDPSMFETLASSALRHGLPDVVKSAYWRVIDADTPRERIEPAFYHGHVEHVDVPFSLDEEATFLFYHPSIWTALYRRAFLDAHRIRMPELPGAGWADNPWLIETLAQAKSMVYVDKCLYYYREFNTGSSSNVKDPAIIYGRWFDMDVIVRRLGITAPRILEGHYARGCAYMDMLSRDFDEHDPEIRAALSRMATRIDGNVVARSKRIPWFYREAYYRQTEAHPLLNHPTLVLRHLKETLLHETRL